MDITGEQDGGIFYREMKHMLDRVKYRSHLLYQKHLNSLRLFAKDDADADHNKMLRAHLCFGSTLAASLYIVTVAPKAIKCKHVLTVSLAAGSLFPHPSKARNQQQLSASL